MQTGTMLLNLFGPNMASDVRHSLSSLARRTIEGPPILEALDRFQDRNARTTAFLGFLLGGVYFALIDKDEDDWIRFGRFFGLSKDKMKDLMRLVALDGEPELSQKEVDELLEEAQRNQQRKAGEDVDDDDEGYVDIPGIPPVDPRRILRRGRGGRPVTGPGPADPSRQLPSGSRPQLPPGQRGAIVVADDAITATAEATPKRGLFNSIWNSIRGSRVARFMRLLKGVGKVFGWVGVAIGIATSAKAEMDEEDPDHLLENAAEFIARTVWPWEVDFEFISGDDELTPEQVAERIKGVPRYINDLGIRRALDEQHQLLLRNKGLEDFIAIDLFKIGKLFSMANAVRGDTQNQINIMDTIFDYLTADSVLEDTHRSLQVLQDYAIGHKMWPFFDEYHRTTVNPR